MDDPTAGAADGDGGNKAGSIRVMPVSFPLAGQPMGAYSHASSAFLLLHLDTKEKGDFEERPPIEMNLFHHVSRW